MVSDLSAPLAREKRNFMSGNKHHPWIIVIAVLGLLGLAYGAYQAFRAPSGVMPSGMPTTGAPKPPAGGLPGGGGLPVETVAAHAGTIAYELLCGVTGRVHVASTGALPDR